MKFSLKAIFALLTIAGLLALVYQEKLKLAELDEQIKMVEAKIASYDPRLEKDLPLLRRAIEPDATIDELLAHVEANVAKLVRQNQPDDLDPGKVSIFYQPSLGDKDPVKVQVYVPEKLTATFSAQIVDAKHQPVDQQATDLPFQPHQPFAFQLPTGLSTMEIGLAVEAIPTESTDSSSPPQHHNWLPSNSMDITSMIPPLTWRTIFIGRRQDGRIETTGWICRIRNAQFNLPRPA